MASKIYVSTSALGLIDVSGTPVKDAIITSLLEGTKLPEAIMKAVFNGMGVKMRRAHAYAKDHYTLGLPQGKTAKIIDIENSDINQYIVTDTGHTDGVYTNGFTYAPLTPAITVLPFLFNDRVYDMGTTEIFNYPPGLTFSAGVATFPQRVTVDYIRTNADNISADIGYLKEVYRPFTISVRHEEYTEGDHYSYVYYTHHIEYKWTQDGVIFIENVPIPDVGDLTYGEETLIAFYQKLNSLGEIRSRDDAWVYRTSEDLYPELKPDPTAPIVDEFLPVVPIRYKNDDLTDISLAETDLYKTSTKLLKHLKLSLNTFGNLVNKNPDVDDIDHAYVMFGVDLQTEHKESILYLIEFFERLYQYNQTKNYTDFVNNLDEPIVLNTAQNIFEAASGDTSSFEEYGLDLTIHYDYITVESYSGTVGTGEIGEVEKSIVGYTVTINLGPGIPAHGEAEYGDGSVPDRYYDSKRAYLKLKIQETEVIVKEVRVYNLSVVNDIYKDHDVTTTIRDVGEDSDEHNLLLPLQFNLSETFTFPQRNALYAKSSMMVINSYEKVKVKWYQTGFFKFLVIVVAIIITIWTGQGWVAGLAVAAGQGALYLIMYLAMPFLIALALDMAMDWLVTVIGPKFALIAAVVALAVALVVPGAGTMTLLNMQMTTSQVLLQGSAALVSSTNEFLVEEGQEIVDDYVDFQGKLEDRYEELKLAQDLLEWETHASPLSFILPSRFKSVPNETPTQFFQRCTGLPDNTMYTIHGEIPDFVQSKVVLQRNVSTNLLA
ncbi:MAG: hypothetical protein DRH26_01065 [Deltaproteobacteria bacterium]|nr:MAG: hypothetical protein DRH26_01065 [Deltaproteobacteria bacterium]